MKHWMRADFVLPIVTHLYKPSTPIVLYTSISHGKGKFIYMTDEYTFNADDGTVLFRRYEDEIARVDNTKVCMIWIEAVSHFQVVSVKMDKPVLEQSCI